MNELEDLPRRLAELAQSGGPWDDPLPEVRRRVDAAAGTAVVGRRRWRITGPTVLALVAALVLVVGLGALVQHHPTQSEKSATAAARAVPSANGSTASGAAAAGGSAAGGSTAGGSTTGGSTTGGNDSAPTACGPPPRYDLTRTVGTLSLSTPGRIAQGRPLTVEAHLVRAGGTAPATVADLRVLVLRGGRVVGELATTSKPVPMTAVPAGATRRLSATGVLGPFDGGNRCAPIGRLPGPLLPRPTTTSSQPVPPGRYQLVAALGVQASASGAGVVLSQPVDITVY